MSRVVVNGIGWGCNINAEIEGDKITFNLEEFKKFMGVIASTHDAISGGFYMKIED